MTSWSTKQQRTREKRFKMLVQNVSVGALGIVVKRHLLNDHSSYTVHSTRRYVEKGEVVIVIDHTADRGTFQVLSSQGLGWTSIFNVRVNIQKRFKRVTEKERDQAKV